MNHSNQKQFVSPEVQRAEYRRAMTDVALRRGLPPQKAAAWAQAQLDEQDRLRYEAAQEKARQRAEAKKQRRQNASKETK